MPFPTRLLWAWLVPRLVVSLSLPYATWPGVHKVTSWDGTVLPIYSEKPVSLLHPKQTFPLVIFLNSWALSATEYMIKTVQWAAQGYICIEYAARGWWGSGGYIDVAGPNSVKDAIAVIDWALKEFPNADPTKIAMGGVSYGSVISQLASATDPRIRAVLAMSGTSNVLGSIYWQQSPSQAWGWALLNSGRLPFIGREEQYVAGIYKNLMNHTDMSFVTAWAANRSMICVIDKVNANGPAIYVSHQHQDNLFHSTAELKMWQRLTGPKKIDLNQGTHASAEILGINGIYIKGTASAHIWGNALRWLDRYLKGISALVVLDR